MCQAVLHGEVGNRWLILVTWLVHISAELSIHIVQALHELFIFAQLSHSLEADDIEQHNWVGLCAMPCIDINVTE